MTAVRIGPRSGRPVVAHADAAEAADGPDAVDPVQRTAWRQLAVGSAAAALLQADGPLITVALPGVGRAFGVPAGQLAVVLVGYFATYALTLPLGGRLTDRLGARRVGAAGLVLFAVASLVGAVAPSFQVLVAARVVQGVGAGLASPAALVGAISGFPPARRGLALGLWGASTGMANIASPLLGGLLTQAFGWRATWWFFAPVALLLSLASLRILSASPPPPSLSGRVLRRPVVAAIGLATLTFGLLVGVFYLIEQYLQQALGYQPLAAAAALSVVALVLGAAAPMAGRLADRSGERPPLVLGLALLAAGLALGASGAVPLHGVAALPILILVGAGLGFVLPPTTRAALGAVPASHHGRASAALSTGRVAGAALGSGLAGLALRGEVSTTHVRLALVVAIAVVALMVPLTILATPAGRPDQS